MTASHIAELETALRLAETELMRCSHILAGDEALNAVKQTVAAALSGSSAPVVVVPQSALDWLFGSGPDANGKWFGEVDDEGRFKPGRGAYWWRSHFRTLISQGHSNG